MLGKVNKKFKNVFSCTRFNDGLMFSKDTISLFYVVLHRGLKSSGADVRVSCAIFNSFCNQEFIAAQRMRFAFTH